MLPEWLVVILVHIASLTLCKVLSQHIIYSMGIYEYLFITLHPLHPNEIEILVILKVRKPHNVCNRPSNEHSWKCESNWYSSFREDKICYCKTITTTTTDDTDLIQMLIKQQHSYRKNWAISDYNSANGCSTNLRSKTNLRISAIKNMFLLEVDLRIVHFCKLQVTLSLRRRTNIYKSLQTTEYFCKVIEIPHIDFRWWQ